MDIHFDIDSIGKDQGDPNAVVELFRERDLRTLATEAEALVSPGSAGTAGTDTPEASVAKTVAAPAVSDLPAAPAGSVQQPVPVYSSVLDEDGLKLWEKKIRGASLVALDTETDNIDPMLANLAGISVAVERGEAAYIPVVRADGPCLPRKRVLEWLADILADESIRIIGQNFKYDMKVLRRAGIMVPGAWFDTMIAAWVIDASSPVGMDALAHRYLGVQTVKFKDVVPKGGIFADVPLDDAVRYAAEDADITLRLYEVLSPLLERDTERLKIFRDIEMPLQPILARMEMEGIGLDIFELDAYGEELGLAIDSLVKDIYQLCGHEFNIASPKQLQVVLFEERGLTPGKKTKTGYSTDNTVLTDLAQEDPVPEKILLYRSLTKLKSTYVDSLPKLVHPQTGRLHTSYMQTGAATGRLSSNNPNLQNIPVRDDNGRRIRSAFKSRPGHVFVSADYSQIELVVLAHMSGDEALSTAFRENVDVHARTAALLFGIDAKDVTAEQRRMAKAVNFGVMYGMSAFRLSNELGISRKGSQTLYRGLFHYLFRNQALCGRRGTACRKRFRSSHSLRPISPLTGYKQP